MQTYFMNRLVIVIVISFCCLTSPGQRKIAVRTPTTKSVSQCQLNEAPTLRGFFIGQSLEEISKLIPNFRAAYETTLRRETVFSSTDYTSDISEGKEIGLVQLGSDYPFPYDFGEPLAFTLDEDVSSINWFFFKDKLYAFAIYYAEYDPPTARSFAKQLTEKTNLPYRGWVFHRSDVDGVLQCKGFKVYVHTAYRNFASLTITDTNIEAEILRLEKEIKKRKINEERLRIQRELEKTRVFKP